jgi:hypothetical protein
MIEITEVNNKKIKIARTRSGVPCLWESLTKFEDLKRATIILSAEGKPKRAYYYNEEREKQALVGIGAGDYMVKCFEDCHGVAISVFRVEEISHMDNTATIYPVYRKSSLINTTEYPGEYSNMIDICESKLSGMGRKIVAFKEYELENAL